MIFVLQQTTKILFFHIILPEGFDPRRMFLQLFSSLTDRILCAGDFQPLKWSAYGLKEARLCSVFSASAAGEDILSLCSNRPLISKLLGTEERVSLPADHLASSEGFNLSPPAVTHTCFEELNPSSRCVVFVWRSCSPVSTSGLLIAVSSDCFLLSSHLNWDEFHNNTLSRNVLKNRKNESQDQKLQLNRLYSDYRSKLHEEEAAVEP